MELRPEPVPQAPHSPPASIPHPATVIATGCNYLGTS
jgi:hypothetical protein